MAKSSEELKLPTVIVDLANDCQVLLDQLLAGSSSAGDKLVQVGEPAVAVLAAGAPGRSLGYCCACGSSTPQPTVSSSIALIEKCVVRNRRSLSVL